MEDEVKNSFSWLYGSVGEKDKINISDFSQKDIDEIKKLIVLDIAKFSDNYAEDPLAIARIFLNLEAQLRGKIYLLNNKKLSEKIKNTLNYLNSLLNAEFSLSNLVFEATRGIEFGRHRLISKIESCINPCRNELLGFIELFTSRKSVDDLDLSDLELDLQEDKGIEEKEEKDDNQRPN